MVWCCLTDDGRAVFMRNLTIALGVSSCFYLTLLLAALNADGVIAVGVGVVYLPLLLIFVVGPMTMYWFARVVNDVEPDKAGGIACATCILQVCGLVPSARPPPRQHAAVRSGQPRQIRAPAPACPPQLPLVALVCLIAFPDFSFSLRLIPAYLLICAPCCALCLVAMSGIEEPEQFMGGCCGCWSPRRPRPRTTTHTRTCARAHVARAARLGRAQHHVAPPHLAAGVSSCCRCSARSSP